MAFWLTGKSPLRGNEGQPRPTAQVFRWETEFDDWMRGVRDETNKLLTLNFYTYTSINTEFIWRLFPIVILALPVATIVLSVIVQSSFGRWSAKGKLLLVLPSRPCSRRRFLSSSPPPSAWALASASSASSTRSSSSLRCSAPPLASQSASMTFSSCILICRVLS